MADVSVTISQKILHIHGSLILKPGMIMTVAPGMTIICEDFIANGEIAKPITLHSLSSGGTCTLSVASGLINVIYCSITDNIATGGAIFNAYLSNGNINGGGNTGWNFVRSFAITFFTGNIGEIEIGRSSAKLEVVSLLEKFNIQWPNNIYTPACGWALYSPGCGLDKDDFTDSGAVVSGSTESIINTDLTAADNFYNQGGIEFLTGYNAGARRIVKLYTHTSGQVKVIPALEHAPVATDTFNIYPGCDKLMETCSSAKFGDNSANYRGEQFIPVPETAT